MKATRYLLAAAIASTAWQIQAQPDSGKSGEVESQTRAQQESQPFYRTSGQIGEYHQVADASQTRKPCHASEIIGLDVRNAAGEKIGSVEDLIVDLQSGRINYAVISSGGVLGVGSKLVAVPAKSLAYTVGEKDLSLNMDKQALAAAPGFSRNHEPDWSDANWTAQVDRYYQDNTQLTPTGRDASRGNPDRTGQPEPAIAPSDATQNARPADFGEQPTAGVKSDSKDAQTTEQVRRAFSASDLSTTASGVQVDTRDGQVILTGTVSTRDQKDQLVNKARMLVGNSRVVDQIQCTESQPDSDTQNNLK